MADDERIVAVSREVSTGGGVPLVTIQVETAGGDPRESGRWRADDAHRDSARKLEDDLSEAVFSDIDELVERRILADGFELEDPDEAVVPPREEGGKPYPIHDPEVWPVGVVDGDGRRYEVEIEVSVRPLPPVPVHVAQIQADIAAAERVQALLAERDAQRAGTSHG